MGAPTKPFFRNNGLSLVLVGTFLVIWAGQAIVGCLDYNDDRQERGTPPVGFGAYLRSSHFLEATAENWESEFLQMGAYVFLTVYLVQRGSAESNDPDAKNSPGDDDPTRQRGDPDAPWSVRRGGWVLKLYEHSLVLPFSCAFSSHSVSPP